MERSETNVADPLCSPDSVSASSRQHVATLDGFRGVTILMVLGIHFAFSGALPHHALIRWMFPLLVSGWIGVDLFFVLSGFLITGILLDSRDAPNYFGSFYVRRTLRIFPLYYLVVVAMIAATPLLVRSAFFAPLTPGYETWLSYLLYVQNWWIPLRNGTIATLVGAYWSLGVEEQFYLLWPLVIRHVHFRRLQFICLATCAFCFVLRVALLRGYPHSMFVLTNTLTRMDTLLWGALAALHLRDQSALERAKGLLAPVALVCFLGLLIIAFPLHELYARGFYTQSIGYTLIGIGCSSALLMVYLADASPRLLPRMLRSGILRSFGRYSYGLYIFHGFVLAALEWKFNRSLWWGKSLGLGLLTAAVFLAGTYGIALLSYRFYESRFLRLKAHFQPRT